MVYYHEDGTPVVEPVAVPVRRSRGGSLIGALLLILVIIAVVLFATGFWSADVTQPGMLPKITINGGQLPKLNLESKKIVVGTKKEVVDVPSIGVNKTDDAASN